ncbi:MAG: M55 family metallopeptidase [Candidatus Dormibacteria bacterium]
MPSEGTASGPSVYISCDMEGVAGIADWSQVIPGPQYQLGQELMLAEVNAAIEGAHEAGARRFLVNDSHGRMANLDPARLAGRAGYLAGWHKPHYMMEGLDQTFDAVFFIGYHGAVDAPPAILSHTYSPRVVAAATVDALSVGEAGLNCLVAAHFGVPVALVSGDQHAGTELSALAPGLEVVTVKSSITRFAAQSLHPEEARERIRAGAMRALGRLAELTPPRVPPDCRIRVTTRNADLARLACRVREVAQVGELELEVAGADRLEVFRNFVAVLEITRQLAAEG